MLLYNESRTLKQYDSLKEGAGMIKDMIQRFLNKKLAQKKHEYIKMQWEKARLEQMLLQAKSNK